jgi:hypothetical protein
MALMMFRHLRALVFIVKVRVYSFKINMRQNIKFYYLEQVGLLYLQHKLYIIEIYLT